MLTKYFDANGNLTRISSDSGQYKPMGFVNSKDKIVVYSHNDSDGKLGARLVYDAFCLNSIKNFQCCDYNVSLPDASLVKDGDMVFIIDYCIPLEQFKPIAERAGHVIFMDHHKTALDMVKDNFEYFDSLIKESKLSIDIDMTRCGARITNDYFITKNPSYNWNQDVVYLVDDYDRWVKDDPRSDYLNQFIFNSAQSYVNSSMWEKLLYSEDYFEWAVEVGRKFFEMNLYKNELIYESFHREVEFHGMKMAVVEGFGNSQLFGEHIKNYDCVCVYHITKNNRWQYSFYTDKPHIKVNKIAEIYGGGGHNSASGVSVSEKLF